MKLRYRRVQQVAAGDGYKMVNIARRLGYIDIQDK